MKRKMSMRRRQSLVGLGFVSPLILGLSIYVAYPVIRTIYFSLNTVQYSASRGYLYEFVGFSNYKRILFEDIDSILAMQDFIIKIFAYVPFIVALSIIIAMLLNQKFFGTTFFRVIFFLPIIILSGEFMINLIQYGGLSFESSGFIFKMIEKISPPFLVSGITLLFDTILEVLWYSSVPVLIFLSALQKNDESIKEAAAIDGASKWQFFWKITLPMLRPFIAITIVYIVVFLGNWDLNPINQIISNSQYDASRREGYASAIAVIYAILQTSLIVILFLLTSKKEPKEVSSNAKFKRKITRTTLS